MGPEEKSSHVITALKVRRGSRDRINVFLDDRFSFSVHLMAAARLKKGQELSRGQIEELKREDERQCAYERGIRFLGLRPRSRVEVETYLKAKGYSGPAVGQAIERLLRHNYLDDKGFARFWVENRERFRPRSARALRYELSQKGLSKEVIEEVLETLDEKQSAWAAVARYLPRWERLDEKEFKKKALGLLYRRGFDYEISRAVQKRAWESVQASRTMEEELS